jgi:hypothetical protein
MRMASCGYGSDSNLLPLAPGRWIDPVDHSILVAAYHMFDRSEAFTDLGTDRFVHHREPVRHATKLVRQLKAPGYDVTVQPVEAA